MNSTIRLVLTEDGSYTLFNHALGEHYHSVHGAVQESRHVFLDAGYRHVSNNFDVIRILEVGFGTGLNGLLTLAGAVACGVNTRYQALEPYPPELSVIAKLNYCNFPGLEKYVNDFRSMHQAVPDKDNPLHGNFIFRLSRRRLQDMKPDGSVYNLVYFDAFSPEIAPELWEPEIFQHLRLLMETGGVLVTYSAKGRVRRSLQKAGFTAERLPGPPGKREMLRATAI